MKRRYNSIDILRALAILEMIIGHIFMLFVKESYILLGFVIVSLFGAWAEGTFTASITSPARR